MRGSRKLPAILLQAIPSVATVGLLSTLIVTSPAGGQTNPTQITSPGSRNVILVTLDGVRVEEIFGGLDLEVLRAVTEKGPVEETSLYKKYWAPTSQKRRELLMPFFWGTLMARHGSIAGNPATGSRAMVTNGHRFSYPGYSEILTGQAHDDIVNSNDARRNPFPSVLEFLKQKLGLNKQQVAVFASWSTFDWIVEHEPGAITSNAGVEAYEADDPVLRVLNDLQSEAAVPWENVRHDSITFRFAMAHLAMRHPRVLHIAFDEPDDWAHDGRYDQVLSSLSRIDRYLEQLWGFVQSNDDYRDKTSLVVTVDHGRGQTAKDWRNHGAKIEGAQNIWIALISPDVSSRGEWAGAATVYQNQIAATLASFMGLDYSEFNPHAGKAIDAGTVRTSLSR